MGGRGDGWGGGGGGWGLHGWWVMLWTCEVAGRDGEVSFGGGVAVGWCCCWNGQFNGDGW